MDKWLNNVNVIRVISLVVGLMFWLVVHMDNQISPAEPVAPVYKDKVVNMNIKKIGLDTTQFHLTSLTPETVKVTVRALANELNRYESGQVIADLSEIHAGSQTVSLQTLGFPDGFQIRLEPPIIAVVAEEVQSREMAVSAQLTGEPMAGFKAGTPVITPSRVFVSGPKSQIDSIVSLTAEVAITGSKEAVKDDYKLVALDKDGNPVATSIQPPVVNIEVPITIPFKKVPLRIKLTGMPPTGFSIAGFKQNYSEVTVYGPQEVLDDLQFYEGPSVDLSKLTSDKTYALAIPLKDQIEQVLPAQVNVELDIVPSSTLMLDSIPLTLNGANDQYSTHFIDPPHGTISVHVEGAPEVLENLKVADVKAFIDISNLPAGEHELTITFNLPLFVKIAPDQSDRVRIEIAPLNAPDEAGSDEAGSDEAASDEDVPRRNGSDEGLPDDNGSVDVGTNPEAEPGTDTGVGA